MSQKIKLHIKGMHCRSCEILLERNISKVQGIRKVSGNFNQSTVELQYVGEEPNLREVEKAIIHAGYSIGTQDKKTFFSKELLDYFEVAAAAAVIFMLYEILDALHVFEFTSKASSQSGLWGALLVGLTAGVSTCMALIGGLVLSISARHAEVHPEATPLQKFRPHIFFNLGRLVSYGLFGGLIGLAGSVFQFSSGVLGILTIALGAVMFFMGMKLTGLFPRLENTSVVLPSGISRLLGLHREMGEYSHRGSFITGALTFFVPCGFTQAMQLYAVSTGSFTQGALIMFLFALGTMPGILSLGGLTSIIKGAFARYFFKFVGVVVILLAFFNMGNGWNLTGINFSLASLIPNVATSNQKQEQPVEIIDGKQIVEMTQAGNGYSPNSFTIKKGIPVVWKIKSTNPYTCAAYIRLANYGIAQPLNPGINTIEFTPTQTGDIRFTCSMGMYSGTFKIID